MGFNDCARGQGRGKLHGRRNNGVLSAAVTGAELAGFDLSLYEVSGQTPCTRHSK